jgi:rhodanese-related sulfurtransferase
MPARLRHLKIAALTALFLVPIGHAMSQQPAQHTAGSSTPRTMTAAEAHAAAQSGDVVLIDIRIPEEWRETGIPAAAHAIDMYEGPKEFTAKLLQVTGGDPTRRVALICRTGNRSATLQAHLATAGFTNVVDVAEGVVGGRFGQGWLKHGLPTRTGTMASTPVLPSSKALPK